MYAVDAVVFQVVFVQLCRGVQFGMCPVTCPQWEFFKFPTRLLHTSLRN
jgi:hypothetical protein